VTVAIPQTVGYRWRVRIVFALFAAMALLVSGIHAGPAEAHEGDPQHFSAHHSDQHDESGSSEPDAGDHYGSHHHCPSFAAVDTDPRQDADFVGSERFKPAAIKPLGSTTRAPPLNPPKP
jgi:hypothetical protein